MNDHTTKRRTRATGFTLVEVLFVLGTIALMLAILLAILPPAATAAG